LDLDAIACCFYRVMRLKFYSWFRIMFRLRVKNIEVALHTSADTPESVLLNYWNSTQSEGIKDETPILACSDSVHPAICLCACRDTST
jgi:hypothetical protein